MATCAQCGAAVTAGDQCPQCGALATDGDLELAIDPPSSPSPPHSPAPSSSPSPAPPLSPAPPRTPAPAPPPPHSPAPSPSYQEQQRTHMRDFWLVTRIPVLLLLGWFTASHLLFDATWVFIDHVNLALHEGGHLMFRPFGDTIYFLGGTLGQLLFPLAFTLYFGLKRRDRFAATATGWWLAENFVGIARYMADAPTRELPLVGGNIHDWWYLLQKWGVLHKAESYASTLRWLGAAGMLATLAALVYFTVRPRERDLDAGLDE